MRRWPQPWRASGPRARHDGQATGALAPWTSVRCRPRSWWKTSAGRSLTDSLLNWEDGGDRANGAKRLDYATEGLRERAGPIKTFGELAAVRGMEPTVLDRIAPVTSLFVQAGGAFDPATASPQALGVMTPGGSDGPEAIIRAREQAGERTRFDTSTQVSYVGRPFTVRVGARDTRGGYFERTTVVVLTGQPQHPFWVRAVD